MKKFYYLWTNVERNVLKFNGIYLIDWIVSQKITPNGTKMPCNFPFFKQRCKTARMNKFFYRLMWNDWR